MSNIFLKDPDDVLDYKIDWETWLNGDTITDSSWAADTGITVDSDESTTTQSVVWLSGGTAGTTYTVTNSIVTAAGREKDKSLSIVVREE
jgi:hypothetical protein